MSSTPTNDGDPPGRSDSRSTPVLLLSFNRPAHTAKVLEQVRRAAPARVYFAVDGPRLGNRRDVTKVRQARALADTIDWPCSVCRRFPEENLGCRDAVTSAIDWFFAHETHGIILEDDCVPAPELFRFCHEMLHRFADDPRIITITGSHLGLITGRDKIADSYFFSRHTFVWGWATWRRAWANYDVRISQWSGSDKEAFLRQHCARRKERQFLREMLDRVASGDLNTWDFQLLYCALSNGLLTVVPRANLITNIGVGLDATHTKVASPGDPYDLPHQTLRFPLRHPAKVTPQPLFERRLSERFEIRPADVRAAAKATMGRAFTPLIALRPLAKLAILGATEAARRLTATVSKRRARRHGRRPPDADDPQ